MNEQLQERPRSRPGALWLVIPFALFFALAALFYERLVSGSDPSSVPSPLINQPVPEFALPAVEGLTLEGTTIAGFSSDALTGSVSLVNVWGSWCAPCRDEHPLLMKLAERDDIVLYGINHKDKPRNARVFLETLGNPFVAVGADDNGRVSIDWGVYGVPETFVVNAGGCIVHKHIGPLTEALLARKLVPAIEAAKESQTDCRAG
ncbi:MAG: DsbE family thiol:disulfide interchange protein [Pseudomonadota bacterium]